LSDSHYLLLFDSFAVLNRCVCSVHLYLIKYIEQREQCGDRPIIWQKNTWCQG